MLLLLTTIELVEDATDPIDLEENQVMGLLHQDKILKVLDFDLFTR